MKEETLHQNRLAYYDFLVATLAGAPAMETLAAISQRQRLPVETYPHESLRKGWRIIDGFLDEKGVTDRSQKEVAQEFTDIFWSPGGGQVLAFESKYVDGKLMDRSLVQLRSFLGEVGLTNMDSLNEPEDSLAVELDIMRFFVRQSLLNNSNGYWHEYQMLFLNQHLLRWGLDFFKDLGKAPSARFYKGVAEIGYGFLFLEKETYGNLYLESRKTRGEEIYEKRRKKF